MFYRMMAALLFFIAPLSAQRFIPSNEVVGLLEGPAPSVVSPDCAPQLPKIVLKVKIDRTGKVSHPKPVKSSFSRLRFSKRVFSRLIQNAKRIVTLWRYKPFLIGGKPTDIETYVWVPCRLPSSAESSP